jgi:hypothetical protein
MKQIPEIDRRIYELAREYLSKIPGVTQEFIEKHLNPGFPWIGDTGGHGKSFVELALSEVFKER